MYQLEFAPRFGVSAGKESPTGQIWPIGGYQLFHVWTIPQKDAEKSIQIFILREVSSYKKCKKWTLPWGALSEAKVERG
jgi:hypothetical protein